MVKSVSRRLLLWTSLALFPFQHAYGVELVGRTAGQFDVTADGAARYSIPLWSPPGVAGVQPALSLEYSNPAANGHVGVGWSIAGFSAIARCGRTLAQNGALGAPQGVPDDRYCVDGAQLRLTSGGYGTDGSTYDTELATFSRFTARGTNGYGPVWFEVYAKDGLIYEFGNSADSSIELLGTSTPHVWALSRIRDRNGNAVAFVYAEDPLNGGYRPLRVEYAFTAASPTFAPNRVEFVWEGAVRQDTLSGYSIGSVMRETNRLDRIEVKSYQGGSYVTKRAYELAYEYADSTGRSRLLSVQECVGGDCLPATQIAWQNGSTGVGTEIDTATNTQQGFMLADIDLDGRDDLMWRTGGCGGGSITHFYRLANPLSSTGFGSTVSAISSSTICLHSWSDWDGDGDLDLGVKYTTDGLWRVLPWNGAGFGSPQPTGLTNPTPIVAFDQQGADVNGDGLDDIVWVNGTYPNQTIKWRLQITTNSYGPETTAYTLGSSEEVAPVIDPLYNAGPHRAYMSDFNADGRQDLLIGVYDYPTALFSFRLLLSNGVLFETAGTITDVFQWGTDMVTPLLGDFNGDAKTDFTYMTGSALMGLAFGNGLGIAVTTLSDYGFLGSVGEIVTDWDGDGLADVIFPYGVGGSETWQYSKSHGQGFRPAAPLGFAAAGSMERPTLGDINGDGLPDLIGGEDTTPFRIRFRAHTGPAGDLAASITDGFGVGVTFNYQTLGSGTCYSRDAPAPLFPSKALMEPMHTVCSSTAGNGVGGTYSLTYNYFNANAHRQGRGFLGFGKRTVADSRSGIFTEEIYNQSAADFHSIGAPSSIVVKQSAAGAKIEDTALTWSFLAPAGSETRRFPYVSQSVIKNYEVGGLYNGTHARTTTTSVAGMDTWGTPTDTTVTTREEATGLNPGSTHTRSELHVSVMNDPANWCLSKPTSTQFISGHTLADGGQLTRTVSQGWDAAKCRLTQRVAQPGDPLQLATTIEYDTFGKVFRETVSDSEPLTADRVTEVNWGSSGRFPETTTNAESHVTTRQWDSALGVPLSETPPNGTPPRTLHYDVLGRLFKIIHADTTRTMIERSACNAGNSYCGAGSLARYKVAISRRQQNEITVIADGFEIFDAFDRALRSGTRMPRVSGAEYGLVDTSYDALGRRTSETAPYFPGGTVHTTTHLYDQLNRLRFTTSPESDATGAPSVTTETVYEGLAQRLIDAEGKKTRWVQNAVGEIVQVTNAFETGDAATATYTYDSFGSPKTLTGSDSRTITHSYNDRNFRTQTLDPNMGAVTYEYWATGELRRLRDSMPGSHPWTATMTYDRLGRMTQRTDVPENASTTWTWDTHTGATCSEGQSGGWGRGSLGEVTLVQGSTPQYAERYCYDNLGRLSAKRTTIAGQGEFGFQWMYASATGLLDTLTYPAAPGGARLRLRHEYSSGQVSTLSYLDQPEQLVYMGTDRNARGQLLWRYAGEGYYSFFMLNEYMDFDAVTGRLQERYSEGLDFDTFNVIQNSEYQWDAVGNLELRRESARTYNGQPLTERFEYDALYRLDKVRDAFNTLKLDVDYSSNGNITRKSDIGGDTLYQYTHATHPHAVSQAGPNTYTYDNNGNQITRNGYATTWYSYNLPLRITYGSSDFSEFLYGPDRQRYWQNSYNSALARNESGLSIDGLFEKRVSGSETTYHYLIYADGDAVARGFWGGGAYFDFEVLHRDALGSVVAVSNPGFAGLIQSFDAWGQRRDAYNWTATPPSPSEFITYQYIGRRGYTGHEHLDNLNLIHMNGRVDAPAIGRFMSPDPYMTEPYNSQGLNRYSYVNNRPLAFTDPTGFAASTPSTPEYCGIVNNCDRAIRDEILEEIEVIARRRQQDVVDEFWLRMQELSKQDIQTMMLLEAASQDFGARVQRQRPQRCPSSSSLSTHALVHQTTVGATAGDIALTLSAVALTAGRGPIETPAWSYARPTVPVMATRAIGAANNAFLAKAAHLVGKGGGGVAAFGHGMLAVLDYRSGDMNGMVFNAGAAGAETLAVLSGNPLAALTVGGALLVDAGITATGVKEEYDTPWGIYSPYGWHRVGSKTKACGP